MCWRRVWVSVGVMSLLMAGCSDDPGDDAAERSSTTSSTTSSLPAEAVDGEAAVEATTAASPTATPTTAASPTTTSEQPAATQIPPFTPVLEGEGAVDLAAWEAWDSMPLMGRRICFIPELTFQAQPWTERSWDFSEEFFSVFVPVPPGENCDATITFVLDLEPLAAEYPRCDPTTQWTGTSGVGYMELTAPGKPILSTDIAKSETDQFIGSCGYTDPSDASPGLTISLAFTSGLRSLGLVSADAW